ncbi:hypothetical protein BC835DRAFT_1418161 [Cytidiella melzeri]|nr:hypothetical protein BC835DRAFT_1418161 [Cytidiella melzeri]
MFRSQYYLSFASSSTPSPETPRLSGPDEPKHLTPPSTPPRLPQSVYVPDGKGGYETLQVPPRTDTLHAQPPHAQTQPQTQASPEPARSVTPGRRAVEIDHALVEPA